MLQGTNITVDRTLVHDNGQDKVMNAGPTNGLTLSHVWTYFGRENPLYPGQGYSFNEPQSQGCTHADGVQFWTGGVQDRMTVSNSVFGPLGNQGLYPSDGETGATVNNVKISNTLFLSAQSHNLITDNPVYGWSLDQVTLFATQGGLELPTNTSGSNSVTNTIKYGGYVYMPNWRGVQSGNVTHGGDNLFGLTPTDPQFRGPVPTNQLPHFAQLRNADFTPQCGICAGKGSSITSVQVLLDRIDELNGRRP
jgi:hypothetical protein